MKTVGTKREESQPQKDPEAEKAAELAAEKRLEDQIAAGRLAIGNIRGLDGAPLSPATRQMTLLQFEFFIQKIVDIKIHGMKIYLSIKVIRSTTGRSGTSSTG